MVGKKEDEVQERRVNEDGDGVAWFRGSMIGKGGFGCVYLATLKNPRSKYSCFPSVMAVKSAEVSASGSIQKEREVLSNLRGCPNVIKCFGEETTMGVNGAMVYNLLLEYGSGGTLADRIKKFGNNGLPEVEVKVFAKSILRGLNHIHEIGYVHCDLKPDNILLMPDPKRVNKFRAKIGDFGLTKRAKQSKKRKLEPYWRGTPMYLSPEAVMDNLQDPPCDIWAFGCIVLEMLTGKPPWDENRELSAEEILARIGTGGKLPKIPNDVSKDARDFLKGCFVRKFMYRLTAEMLLNHRFLEGLDDDDEAEEPEEVEDLNEIESILLVSESDDELSCGLYPDEWGALSEEELFYYSSEEDNVEDEIASSTLSEERELKEEHLEPDTGSQFNQPNKKLRQVSLESRQPYPVSFTIPAGVV
ncbi:MEKK [Handroanthus impetiginosus]|uniref:MEKK n=1 Tax=Handroanthus impetiginosus TaxID=429701 RepID=A0A2G9G411_9LAMI|nr:MEKK [Handroanthus impetiginosus]